VPEDAFAVVEEVYRTEWGRILATLIRIFRTSTWRRS